MLGAMEVLIFTDWAVREANLSMLQAMEVLIFTDWAVREANQCL